MMKRRYIPLIILPLAWMAASAASLAHAADTPAKEVISAAERSAMHKDMCSEHFGHKIGRLAALETRLALSEPQRAAWVTWSRKESAAAAAERDACLANEPKGEDLPNAIEEEALMERDLGARLSHLQDARVAMQALYDGLNADQKKSFDRFMAPPPPPFHFPFLSKELGGKHD